MLRSFQEAAHAGSQADTKQTVPDFQDPNYSRYTSLSDFLGNQDCCYSLWEETLPVDLADWGNTMILIFAKSVYRE